MVKSCQIIGPLAQLVARLDGIEKVAGSNPARSTIGKNIKRYRNNLGISQDRSSKLADVIYNTIIKIESGVNKNPTIQTVVKITKALNIKMDDLIK